MILVDTSVWVDYFNGVVNPQTDWLDAALGTEPVVMGDLILAEILQGFQNDRDYRKAQRLLEGIPFMDMLGRELAVKSAQHYRYLRKKGVTVRKTIDVMIGTFCIHHGIALLHRDRDFVPMEKYLNLMSVVPTNLEEYDE
ncbi:MAG: Ribonuclease VapC11 [Syntrophorhabdus sp. PtaB.Bin047]|jgi:predicted nucleic acid-binding protein|nr:MAG: Ribonuclease VapC11 [Syntrophorhabdus sp. PtaB.Bin047]